jgi:hypothetical protein
MADQTNPYVAMGMMGMYAPNKYIDPAYKDKPLPLPGFYGTPTDAQGAPIQSYLDAQSQHDAWNAANPAPAQGTTLNTNPTPGLQQSDLNQAFDAYSRTTTKDTGGFGGVQRYTAYNPVARPQTQPQAQSAPAPTNPIDMRQAYLDALSNPGKVTTPGATVPQAQPLGSPSVLNAFLAANPGGGGAGAGNYNNSGFFDTLNKLRSA